MKTAHLCPTKEHFIYQVSKWLKLGKTWSSGATDVRGYYWDRNQEETCVSAVDWHINFFPKNEVYEGYEIRTVELPKEELESCDCLDDYCASMRYKESEPKEESLRDGETKVTGWGKDEVYCDWFSCNKCGNGSIQEESNFCPGCGRKIIRTPN